MPLNGTLADRPRDGHHSQRHHYELLLTTLKNGKALRLAVNGATFAGVQSSLRSWVRRNQPDDVRLRVKSVPSEKALYAWLERREATPPNVVSLAQKGGMPRAS